MDIVTLSKAKRYIDSSIAGIDGVLAGKNCKIQSVEDITNGHRITFFWNDDEDIARTTSVDVMDGNSLEDIDIKYAISESGKTPPSGWWSSYIPSVPDGYYLWTRNTLTFSNGETKVEYLISKQGVNGVSPTVTITDISGGHEVKITDKDGNHFFYVMDGLAIDFIDVDYAESASGTVAPAAGWQSNPPEVATGNFLWTRNTTHLMDGTTSVAYMVALQGAEGISPTVEITPVSGGNRVVFTDKDGSHPFTVLDGVDGVDGRDGADGNDGFSPIITTDKVGKTTTITIVDADGTKYATILDGIDGKTITNIVINSQNHVIVTYSDGTTSDAGELIVQSAVMSVNGQTGDVELELPDVVNVGANLSYNSQTNTISADAQSIDIDSEISSTSENPVQNKVIKSALDTKVDKETGKGLSTNDYTTAEKEKLSGIASGAEVNIQSDWNQTDTEADDYIKNKPDIPAMQLQSDWNQTDTTAKDYIKNKPNFATVATSGSYNDLSNKPSIPAEQVNSDWNSTSGVSKILNKPTLGTAASKNVPSSGNASSTEVVMGNDSRLTNARTPTAHTHTKSEITDFPALGTAAAKNSTNTVAENSTDLVESGAVKTAIDSAISRVYKPAGNKTVAQLTNALLIKTNLGNVYNMLDSGTTTSDFVEGAGKTIELGDNVAVVDVGTSQSPSYKFDLLSGMVDLTNYIQKSQTAGLIKNDGSVDTTSYAKQSEMSVTNGSGANADKVTIQLKSGTSATVLKTHQDISGKVDKVDGKGLSTNDFTDTLKTKLDGIENGAEVNTITGIKGDSESTYRVGDVNITKANIGLGNVVNTGDSATPVSEGTTKFTTGGAFTELAKKVDKVDGKGLSTNDYTTTEKNKLAGIASGAEVNVQSDWNQTDNTKDDFIKNKPTLGTAAAKNVPSSGNASTSQVVMGNDTRLSDSRTPTAHTHTKSEITDFPALADVATSGSYDDLTDKPTIPPAITVDSALSSTSTNPVQNKVINTALNGKTKGIAGITGVSLGYTANSNVPIEDFIAKIVDNYGSGEVIIKCGWADANKIMLTFTESTTTIHTSGLTIIGNILKITSSSALVDMNLLLITVNDSVYTVRISKNEATTSIKSYLYGYVNSDRKVNGHALSADVTVTKSDVGLGNVVNTGDSATPVSGGTTKFTTGGAFTELAKKVDKVDGKGLSTNDFTTTLKDKLDGIEEGAQVNTITGVKGNAETNYRTGNVNLTPDNLGASSNSDTCKWTSVYNNSTSSGYFLIAQKTGAYVSSNSNHDVMMEGTVYSDKAGASLPIDFQIYVRGRGNTVNVVAFRSTNPNATTYLKATYEIVSDSSSKYAIVIRLYGVINSSYHRFNTKIDYSTAGDVSSRSSAQNITYSSTIVSELTGTEISLTAYSVTQATKLSTARKLKVALGSTTDKTFDGSADVTDIPISGTLKIDNGGTGATTDKAAQNKLLGSMNEATSDLGDTTKLVFKYVTPSDENGALYSRTLGYLIKYLNTRIAGRPNLTCSTAGATAAKTVDLAGFVLSKGAQLIITFSNANTVATPTLNVNSTGAKEIRINRTTVSTDSSSGNYLKASTAYYAHYDGSYWQLDTYQVPLARYAASAASATDCSYPESKFDAYCDTAAATVAKVGRCRGFSIYTGAILSLRVTVANTAANPTLNVQSSGAKTIYINGSAVSSSNQLTAGLYIAYYDGTYWQLIKTSAPTLTVDSFISPDIAFSYTAGATVAKTAVMPSFKLITGARFKFYLVNANTVANATLAVNSTTAKAIKVNGAAVTTSNLTAGWYDVIYDGTDYFLYSTSTVVTPITAGGTGQTTAQAIVDETIQAGIGPKTAATSDVTDSTEIITSHVNGYSTTNKRLYRRTADKIWNYIKTKLGISTGTTSYLRNDGTWATPDDHITTASTTGTGNAVTAISADANGALTVTKGSTFLTSHQTVKQDGVTGATVNRFGTCSTAAATDAKTVSITTGTFTLEAGARVSVKFSNANTADNPTLNVNSKGAKNIFHKGAQITTGGNKALLAGVCDFIYDGTQWHLVGNYINTTYESKAAASSGTDLSLVTTGEKYTWGNKQASITGAATSITSSNLTASRALVSDSNGKVAVSSITSTKLGYLTDVTSNIQAQLNNKAGTAVATTSSDGLMSSSDKSKLDDMLVFKLIDY